MQTCLWKALGKQTDGSWTGMTSNRLRDQVQLTFVSFGFFFLGLHMGKIGQVSAHRVKVPGACCLHSQHCPLAREARGATETSLLSWKVRNSRMQCQESEFTALWATRPLWLSHSWLGWIFGSYLLLLLFDGSCLTTTGQSADSPAIPSAASIPVSQHCSRSPVTNHHGMSCPQGHISFLTLVN